MSNPTLDLLGRSQRAATWRFDLLDQERNVIGTLDVDRESPPTMGVDTSRAIKKSLNGISLPPSQVNDVDVIRDRLGVTMILDDDTEWPQGVFLWSDLSRVIISAGVEVQALSAVDQGLIVDQQTDTTIAFSPSTQITTAIESVVASLPVEVVIDSSSSVISPAAEAIGWPAGTSRLRIVNELATMIGYHELFFDNFGVGQLSLMPNPETAPESSWRNYPSGGRTYLGSATRSTDILELPNRFVVLNNGATSTPVYGRYDIPATWPHSAANRGFVITHVEQVQGISTNVDAQAAARSLAREWRYAFETVSFAGPPDPRHDHYDVVNYEDELFLELAWSMPLSEGSAMTHTVRRTYEGEGVES